MVDLIGKNKSDMIEQDIHEYLYSNFVTRILHKLGNLICARMINPNHKLLNIGCGEGILFRYTKNADVCGVDISKESIRKSKERFPNIKFMITDVHNMDSIPDEHFESVCSVYSLEHFRNLTKALEEIKRVLRPNGDFIVSIPAEGWLYSLGRRLTTKKHIERRWKIDYEEFVKKEQHVNTTKDIIKELKKQFAVRYMFGIPSFLPLININLLIFVKCKKL